MATIYCMNCGAPLEDTASYCTECGSPTTLGLRLEEERRVEAAGEMPTAKLGEVASVREVGQDVGPYGQTSAPADSSRDDMHIDPLSVARKGRPGDGRRTALLGVAAALLTFVVVLGAAYAAGFLDNPFGQGAPTPDDVADTGDDQGSDTISLEVRDGLAEYSWSELSTIAKAMSDASTRDEALELARTYHLVDSEGKLSADTREVTIIGVGTMHMRLIGIWHDDLSNGQGKAGLTFLSDDLLFTHRMKETDDNEGGWEQSELRHWLNVDICNSLNDDLRTSIVAVDKMTNNVGHTTDAASVTLTLDKLWVPSVVEIVGPIEWTWDSDVANSALYNAVMNAEGEQYEYFAGMDISQSYGNEGLIRRNESGSISYWLRSSSASRNQHYRTVDGYGNPVRWAPATDELGVCVGFCL